MSISDSWAKVIQINKYNYLDTFIYLCAIEYSNFKITDAVEIRTGAKQNEATFTGSLVLKIRLTDYPLIACSQAAFNCFAVALAGS